MDGDLRCKQIKRLNDLPKARQKVPVAKPRVLSPEPQPSALSPGDIQLQFITREYYSAARGKITERPPNWRRKISSSFSWPHSKCTTGKLKNPSFELNGSPATPLNRNPETEILWLCQPCRASAARYPQHSPRQPDVFTQ